MCVIAVVKSGVALTESHAERMWEANSHGSGFAVYRDGTWQIRKGVMDLSELKSLLLQEGLLGVEDHPPFVIHFRIASVGGVNPELTHPFPITLSDRGGCVFHNGTMDTSRYGGSGMVVPEGESDTSQFAKLISELCLSKEQLTLLVKKGGLLDSLLGGSRLAICIDGEPEPVLVGDWDVADGLLVSNKSWQARRTWTGMSRGYSWNNWEYSSYSGRSCYSCDDDPPRFVRFGEAVFFISGGSAYFSCADPWFKAPTCRLHVEEEKVYLLYKGDKIPVRFDPAEQGQRKLIVLDAKDGKLYEYDFDPVRWVGVRKRRVKDSSDVHALSYEGMILGVVLR